MEKTEERLFKMPKELYDEYVDKFVPEELQKRVFCDENLAPLPHDILGSTREAVISDRDFTRLFQNKDMEFAGIQTNRLMIDVAYTLVTRGNLEPIAADYSTDLNVIRRACLASPDFQKLVNYFCEIVVNELKGTLTYAAGRSIALMTEFLEDSTLDPKLRTDIAKDILDRVGIKKDNKTVVDVNNNVNLFGYMSSSEADLLADLDLSEVIDVIPKEIRDSSEENGTSKEA